jgi:hypothetical protein
MNYVPRQIEITTGASYRHVVHENVISVATYKATASDYFDQFYSHLHKWRSETYFLSSATEIRKHRSFRAIVKMGDAVIPLIIDDLKRSPSLLSLALVDITGESVVPEAARGNVRAMADAWISWGRRNGF